MYDLMGRPLEAMQLADKLIENSAKKGLWPSINLIVETWFKRHPDEAALHKKLVADERSNQKNEYASTVRKNGDLGGVRHMGEIPPEIYSTIDMICYKQIQEYGEKKFWREFFRKYPVFSIAEKV